MNPARFFYEPPVSSAPLLLSPTYWSRDRDIKRAVKSSLIWFADTVALWWQRQSWGSAIITRRPLSPFYLLPQEPILLSRLVSEAGLSNFTAMRRTLPSRNQIATPSIWGLWGEFRSTLDPGGVFRFWIQYTTGMDTCVLKVFTNQILNFDWPMCHRWPHVTKEVSQMLRCDGKSVTS